MPDPIAKIKYEGAQYHDDTGTIWAVTLRRRNKYVGNFTDPDPGEGGLSGVFAFPYQNGRMRYITVKLVNGRTLRFPQQTKDAPNYCSVGALILIPVWDDLNADGTGGSQWIQGTIVGRRGERLLTGSYLENAIDGLPA